MSQRNKIDWAQATSTQQGKAKEIKSKRARQPSWYLVLRKEKKKESLSLKFTFILYLFYVLFHLFYLILVFGMCNFDHFLEYKEKKKIKERRKVKVKEKEKLRSWFIFYLSLSVGILYLLISVPSIVKEEKFTYSLFFPFLVISSLF